ncbi:hypothetical protein [Bacillus xiapuensis]|uniref:Tetratricopeptide repeat protein n=1 Tax=Bacillus xiapuensis TaxID=2014075 RepID=A0ABU6N6Q9_9BACI|nr:hypothetical protein [Bacillus xiapuensis]
MLEKLINELEQKIKLDPENSNLISEYALALLAFGDFPEALNHFEKAAKIKPNIQNLQNLAYFYHYEGVPVDRDSWQFKEKEAIDILEEIIKQEPASFFPYNLLGEIYTSNGQYHRAMGLLKKAYLIQPTLENLNNLGVCFYHKSMLKEAAECFRTAFLTNNYQQTLNPILSCGICMAKIGMREEALLLAENLLAESAKFDNWMEKLEDQIAGMYYLLNDFDKFVEIYSELDLFRYEVHCLPPYLYSLWKLGQFEKTEECFEEHINKLEIDMQDILRDDDPDWDVVSKEERVEEIKADIQFLKTTKENIFEGKKPEFVFEPEIARGCYVFGCKMHNHPYYIELEEKKSGEDTIQI